MKMKNFDEKEILEEELQRSLDLLSKARTIKQVKFLQAKIRYLKEKLGKK